MALNLASVTPSLRPPRVEGEALVLRPLEKNLSGIGVDDPLVSSILARTEVMVATSPEPCGLRLQNVHVRFDKMSAVRDINLAVTRGEFVSLVGPSGCGKSTLLRCVAGLQAPTQGTVTLGMAPTATHLIKDAERIGFVFQRPNLLPWRNVLDNVGLPLELAGVPQRARLFSAREALALVGLVEADETKLPKMLSGGMQMRVSVARAIVTRPTVMLMDEPFASVDDLLRCRLNEEILTLWSQQGWTTLLVTHQVQEAVFLSQRVAVMTGSPGRIVQMIDVPLPYPRTLADRRSPEFAETAHAVSMALRSGK